MQKSIKIYRINRDDYRLESIKSSEGIIEKVIKDSIDNQGKEENLKFSSNELSRVEKDGINYYLYVHKFPEMESYWLNFYPKELTKKFAFEIQNISILLFVDDGSDIFVIVGGKAFRSIIKFIDHTFGLSIISRVIKPDEDMISSITSGGITGSRSGLSEQFRDDLRVADYARFGKIPTVVHAILNENVSKEFFGFLQSKQNERVKIYAGKSFKIKKNINFNELHEIIQNLSKIMKLAENDYLSTYIEIRKRGEIERTYKPLLPEKIFGDLVNIRNNDVFSYSRFKFDFSHPEKLAKFYEADTYVLKEKEKEKEGHVQFDSVRDRRQIYETVLKRAIALGKDIDLYTFRGYIQGVRVLAYSDNKLATSASFLFHFTCEFELNGRPIFLVDNRWYELKASFIDDLKAECVKAIRSKKVAKDILYLPWDKHKFPKEKDYNIQYKDNDEYLVFDTITPDGIELCDIMHVEGEQIYLIHVKYGFDSSLRELANQVVLSARRLYDDIKSGRYKYVDSLYQRIEKKGESRIRYSLEEFRNLFSRKIEYTFAFASGLSVDYSVEDNIEEYTSNIAKYSLVQCSLDMQQFSFGFSICQIKKK